MAGAKWMLAGALLAAGAAAAASIPIGRRVGPWHVVSISSISGDGGGNDAAAFLAQEIAAGKLEANWQQGGPVHVSIRIKDCRG